MRLSSQLYLLFMYQGSKVLLFIAYLIATENQILKLPEMLPIYEICFRMYFKKVRCLITKWTTPVKPLPIY